MVLRGGFCKCHTFPVGAAIRSLRKKLTRPLARWFSLSRIIVPKLCMTLMMVLFLLTMANSAIGSDGWRRFRAQPVQDVCGFFFTGAALVSACDQETVQ